MGKRDRPRRDFSEEIRLYQSGLSVREVAVRLGVSRQSIIKAFALRKVKFRYTTFGGKDDPVATEPAENQEEFQVEDFNPGDKNQQDLLPRELAKALRKLPPGQCIVLDFRRPLKARERNRVRALRHNLKLTHKLRVSFFKQPEPDGTHKIVLQEDLRAKEEDEKKESIKVGWEVLIRSCKGHRKDNGYCDHPMTETHGCLIDECPLRVK